MESGQNQEVEDGFGQLLHTTRLSVPLSSIPEAEREARLRAQAERVAAEEGAVAQEVARHALPPLGRGRKRPKSSQSRPRLPEGREWDSLRVVNCRRCGRVMLGPTDAGLFADTRGMECHAHLPPLYAARKRETVFLKGVAVPVVFFVCHQCL